MGSDVSTKVVVPQAPAGVEAGCCWVVAAAAGRVSVTKWLPEIMRGKEQLREVAEAAAGAVHTMPGVLKAVLPLLLLLLLFAALAAGRRGKAGYSCTIQPAASLRFNPLTEISTTPPAFTHHVTNATCESMESSMKPGARCHHLEVHFFKKVCLWCVLCGSGV